MPILPSEYQTEDIVILSILATAMMILVIVGNMLVIIAIATESNLTNIQNWFIASLAFADLSLGLVIMPFSLAQELLGYWTFGSFWCSMHAALDVLLCTASIMNLCLISLDRYWSITCAIDYLNTRTKPRVFMMIVVVWGISAFISIPPLLGWKQSPDLSWFHTIHSQKEAMNASTTEFGMYLANEMSLEEFDNFTKVLEDVVFPKCQVSDEVGYVMYSALGSFYIPSCIMVFVYIKIYWAARDRVRKNCKVGKEDEQLKGKPKRVLIGGSSATGARKLNRMHCKENNVDNMNCNGWQGSSASNSKDNLVDTNDDNSISTSSGYQQTCGADIIKPRNIFNKLRLGRRLSKDAREIIDTGRPKIIWEPAAVTDDNGVASIEKEKKRIARQKERRATLILGLIMGSFIACWLPFFILYLVGPLCPICAPGFEGSCCVDGWVFSVAFWLGYSNSALNPVIYTVFNKDFRQAFKKILIK